MLLDPQQLGEREVGQRGIAGEFDEALVADLLVQPVALRLGARVTPDKRWAQDRAVFVEHHCAVHLARQADGRNGLAWFGRSGQGFADGVLSGAPPVLWILLSPTGVRRSERRMFAGSAADQLSGCIHHDGARAARTHIHSEEPHRRILLA